PSLPDCVLGGGGAARLRRAARGGGGRRGGARRRLDRGHLEHDLDVARADPARRAARGRRRRRRRRALDARRAAAAHAARSCGSRDRPHGGSKPPTAGPAPRGRGRPPRDPPRGEGAGGLARTLNTMLAGLERARDSERRFLADASHELRTPLTALRGNVAHLARHRATPELVADLEADAERLARLADDLL